MQNRSLELTAARVTLVVLGVLVAALAIFQLQTLVLMLVVATILAAALYSPQHALERRGVPRPVTVVAAYGAVLLAFVGLLVMIGGPLVSQVQQLVADAPEMLATFRDRVVDLVDGLAGEGRGENLIDTIGGALAGIDLAEFVGVPLAMAEVIANAFIVFFMSAFVLMELSLIHI